MCVVGGGGSVVVSLLHYKPINSSSFPALRSTTTTIILNWSWALRYVSPRPQMSTCCSVVNIAATRETNARSGVIMATPSCAERPFIGARLQHLPQKSVQAVLGGGVFLSLLKESRCGRLLASCTCCSVLSGRV